MRIIFFIKQYYFYIDFSIDIVYYSMVKTIKERFMEVSDKSWVVTLILAIFLPVHRFYVGKIGTGILYLITFGGLGIWYIVDIVMIILDKFTDKEGRKLKK